MTKKNNIEKIDDKKAKKTLNKYKDLSGLSNWHLNFGLWLAENRKKIKQSFTIFLIVFAASTLSYSTYHYVDYLFYGRHQDKEMLEGLVSVRVDTEYLRQVMAPDNLLFSLTRAFYVQGKYDFLTKIHNPNPRHRANFYYCFEEGDKELACGESFILPGEKKYVLELAKEIEANVGAVNFVIKDIAWRRITAHIIQDWQSYQNERFRFVINTAEFTVVDGNSYSLNFSVTNNSTFNYLEVPLQIILLRDNKEIGANRYTVRNFISQEKIDLSIVWPAGRDRANRVLIIPEVDILDQSIFIPYSGN